MTAALISEDAALPPNTGFFLSTSAAVDSHEWEAFQGGVFSHELRSALRGAADTDQDGRLTYEEVSAFIWSANGSVPNPRLRPRFFSRPPGRAPPGKAVLLPQLRQGAARLAIGPGISEHLYLEDAQGLRLADLHLGRAQRIALLLPARRPLFVRYVASGREAVLAAGGSLTLASLAAKKTTAARRGAEHLAFRRLFQQAFDARAIRAYQQRPPELLLEQQPRPDWTWYRRGLGLGALGVGLAGGVLSALAASERSGVADGTDGEARQQINSQIERYNTGAVVCYATAGAGLAAYLLWTFWPESTVEVQLIPARDPLLQLSWSF